MCSKDLTGPPLSTSLSLQLVATLTPSLTHLRSVRARVVSPRHWRIGSGLKSLYSRYCLLTVFVLQPLYELRFNCVCEPARNFQHPIGNRHSPRPCRTIPCPTAPELCSKLMNAPARPPRPPTRLTVCSQRSQSGGSGRTPVSTLPLPLRRSTRACTVARLFPQPFFSFCSGIRVNDASIVSAKRSTSVEDMMRTQRKTETPEERKDRLLREVQTKKADAIADEAAVDRMIRQNIAQFGP